MLITEYSPDATAVCPKCGCVECENTGGMLVSGYPRYMDFYHESCGTSWRQPLDGGYSKILGEDNANQD